MSTTVGRLVVQGGTFLFGGAAVGSVLLGAPIDGIAFAVISVAIASLEEVNS